jgi:hypothetical protein
MISGRNILFTLKQVLISLLDVHFGRLKCFIKVNKNFFLFPEKIKFIIEILFSITNKEKRERNEVNVVGNYFLKFSPEIAKSECPFKISFAEQRADLMRAE